MRRTLLLALGGNAILPAGGSGTIEEQRAITTDTLRAVAAALGPQDRWVLTHGNGPVVGNILLRNLAAAKQIPPMPLDVCGADSQGGMGYMMVQCLGTALAEAGKTNPIAALITRVRVDRDDPAFQRPTKPIGPFYEEETARNHAAEYGWEVREDSGRGWRRVVASPRPREVLELSAIQALLDAGHVVVAAGGGGIPVMVEPDGIQTGVEAVVDKDLVSALLATALGFEEFVLVTGVSHVAIRFGRPDQLDLKHLSVEDARRYLAAGEFGEGSMKPKIESALDFLAAGGREVLITSPESLSEALAGRSGTRIGT